MRSLTNTLGAAVVCLAVALGGTPADGAGPRPLPTFDLTALNGLFVSSAGWQGREGKWLLVYTRTGCFGCDTVLHLLGGTSQTETAQRVVVIVAGSAEDASQMAAGFPTLSGVAWYADESGQGMAALGLQGVPVVLALRGGTIEWSLAGLLPRSGDQKAALAAWIGE